MKKPFLLFVFGVFLLTACSSGKNQQFRTDTEPIYNHFPDLPKTGSVNWYSTSTGGIGLSKNDLYVFVFYDSPTEIDVFLESEELSDEFSDIDAAHIPETVSPDEQWRRVSGSKDTLFQDELPMKDQLPNKVYVNESHTMLYLHATW